MSDLKPVRLFVAVTIPEAVRGRIKEAQTELRRALPDANVRWTRREQFHLTLKFLGDLDAARVEALGAAMRAACRGFAPLRLRAAGVGCFPDLRYPRVLWTGVEDEAGQLPPLQQAVDLASRDFTTEEKQEKFTGHVTLARIKGIKRTDAEALGQAAAAMRDRLFGHWTAYKVELMRSELLPQGARHTPLAAIALTDSPPDLA